MAITGDNPIAEASEDLLGRANVAAALANTVRSADASAGYVLAVLGPWGSGKTSLINLTRELLASETSLSVLDFNPWMFSGAEQLVDTFFAELSAQLRLKGPKLKAVSESISRYSKLLSPLAPIPVVGQWAERTGKAVETLAGWAEGQRPSVLELRNELTKKLVELEEPMLVVIDDIDRLSTDDRLTASFPNIIYLLSFDRARVESALGETGIRGRDYLEKIVQASFDLPLVPNHLLMTAFLQAVDVAIEATGANVRFNQDAWPDILAEIIWPLVTTMRDARRYCASIYGTISELQDKIELVDILALEAIRVFLPDVFDCLRSAQVALTSTRDFTFGAGRRNDDQLFKTQIEVLVEMARQDDHELVAKALISRLFPAAQNFIGGSSYGSDWRSTWLKERRVASQDFLELYIERVAGDTIGPFESAEQFFLAMQTGDDVQAPLDAVPKEQLEDTISQLVVWEHEYPVAAIPGAVVALMNTVPDIPGRRRGMLDLGDGSLSVRRIVLRMLRRIDSEDDVYDIVRAVLPAIPSYSSKYELLDLVGHKENSGHNLVAVEHAHELEQAWASEVVQLGQAQLESERRLVRILLEAKRLGQNLPRLTLNPVLTRTMLLDVRSEAHSQIMGNRAVKRAYRLWWDGLIEVAGSEQSFRKGLDALEGSELISDDDLQTTVDVARKYLSGWRPDDDSASNGDQ